MNIVKYITSLFEFREIKKVECAKVWVVSWMARKDSYFKTPRVAKAFLNETDAKVFARSLIDAANILQYEECINIKIEEQKC